MKKITWSNKFKESVSPTKKLLAKVSVKLRTAQYNLFLSTFKPNAKTRVLDVGVTPVESLVDANLFEKLYLYPKKLTAVSVENCLPLRKKYPGVKFINIKANSKLPFKTNSFDIVVCWATLEHVGNFNLQKYFLTEICRVGKNVFVTTPNRNFIYELHTNWFLLHWLPPKIFRYLCSKLGKKFWSDEKVLNLMTLGDLRKILIGLTNVSVSVWYFFGILNTHLIISKKNAK